MRHFVPRCSVALLRREEQQVVAGAFGQLLAETRSARQNPERALGQWHDARPLLQAQQVIPRLRTLLIGRLWEPARDARLWADADGQVVGFAALTPPDPRGGYLPTTLIADPREMGGLLRGAMLDWATGRARERAAGSDAPGAITLVTEADEADAILHRLLMERGCARQDVAVRSMARSAADLPGPVAFPAGFALRQLPPVEELERDPERYGPLLARWGVAQRRRLTSAPDYDPALNLLVDAPDGTIAAYCETSFARTGQHEPAPAIGAIDMIATRPELRGRGIGRALFLAACGRLRAAGAGRIGLFTESTNLAALHLYRALGFQDTRRGWLYTRDLERGGSPEG